jgi:hypothetical protein
MNAPTRTHRPALTLRTPEDVLAKVPYLVGFHPRESLVVLAIRPDQEVHCTLRADLPPDVAPASARSDRACATVDTDVPDANVRRAGDPGAMASGAMDPGADPDVEADVEASELVALAAHLADVVSRHQATHALLVAYTSSPHRVGLVLQAVHLALESVGVIVLDRLIADGQRWWSDACADAGCCPSSGTPYDLEHHPVTARSVYAGEVALADEEALRRSLAPADGDPSAMREVIARVATEIGSGSPADAASEAEGRADVRADVARRFVTALVGTGAAVSVPLTDEQVARACVLVADDRTRVAVAQLISPETARDHQALWTEVLRRTVPPHDSGPATLLAFAAWSGGHGALSRCALERAFASGTDCRLASFVAELLSRGVAPPR